VTAAATPDYQEVTPESNHGIKTLTFTVIPSAVPSRACAVRAREGPGVCAWPGSGIAPARTQVPPLRSLRFAPVGMTGVW